MTDELKPVFEHAALEADIERLSHEVRKTRELPEYRGRGGKEIIKKSLKALTPSAPQGAPLSTGPLPAYADDATSATKLEIEYLLDIAFHKGILAANKEAAKHSPFVIDAFHDALSGRLYPELQRRGLVP